MAKSLPTLIAFLLSVYGINMFGSNYVQITSVPNLYASCLIKLGMYFLLLDVNLYQKSFKKLHSIPLFFYEFITASFFIDTVVHYIWIPIERYMIFNIPKLVKFLFMSVISYSTVYQVLEIGTKILLGTQMMKIYCYALSLMFVLCVVHATRAIDFRILSTCGISCFTRDVKMRFMYGIKKLILSKQKIRDIKMSRPCGCRRKRRKVV